MHGVPRSPRPGASGIAALVKIVHHGRESHARFREFVTAGGPVDKRIGRVARALERHRALSVIDAEIRECAANGVGAAQVFDDFELGHLDAQPAPFGRATAWHGALRAGEPLSMIEREAGNGEEEYDGKAGHRQIHVEPTRPRGERAFPRSVGGLPQCGRSGFSLWERVCGSQARPTRFPGCRVG